MYQLALALGVDLIAPAILLFVFFYALLPWQRSILGWAMMTHAVGSLMLFGSAVLTQHGILPPTYPGQETVILAVVVLWIFGWYLLAYSVIHPRIVEWLAAYRARTGV